MIGERSWKNIWSIKALLWGFELASGLWVNLSKSKLYGINLDVDFLQTSTSFLSCSFGTIPFVFLAFPLVLVLEDKILGRLLFTKSEEGWWYGITYFCLLVVGWFF